MSEWENSVPHMLWRAQNAVHRVSQQSLDELGVTVTQLGLAVHLSELGPLSASDLARGFHLTPQSVTTALLRLEQLEWLSRAPHPVHKRVILHHLTEKGVDMVKVGEARMHDVGEQVTSVMTAGELNALLAQLRKIVVELDGPGLPTGGLWPVRG